MDKVEIVYAGSAFVVGLGLLCLAAVIWSVFRWLTRPPVEQEPRPALSARPLELPDETAQSITDRMVRKNWK